MSHVYIRAQTRTVIQLRPQDLKESSQEIILQKRMQACYIGKQQKEISDFVSPSNFFARVLEKQLLETIIHESGNFRSYFVLIVENSSQELNSGTQLNKFLNTKELKLHMYKGLKETREKTSHVFPREHK